MQIGEKERVAKEQEAGKQRTHNSSTVKAGEEEAERRAKTDWQQGGSKRTPNYVYYEGMDTPDKAASNKWHT